MVEKKKKQNLTFLTNNKHGQKFSQIFAKHVPG